MKERNREIDLMKGLLTLAMILCHCIQFFGIEDRGVQKYLADGINLTTFSGFLFCFGYVCKLAYYQKGYKDGMWKMAKNAVRLLLAFYISGIAYLALVEQKIFRWDIIREVLLLQRFPGWSEFLASFAAVLFIGILLFPVMKRMNVWMLLIIAALGAAGCFLPYDQIKNPLAALLMGSDEHTTFPVLQYGMFFAAGVWAGGKKIRWDWKIGLGAALLSGPCIWYYIQNGYLPQRFPPSILYITGGILGVYLYQLASMGLQHVREKNRYLEKAVAAVEVTGKNSLYYLLMSNLLIFAVAGSHFSFRSELYAYGFYVFVFLLIHYLNRLRR